MKKVILLCLMLGLVSCAQMTRATPDQQFEAYRTEVKSERQSGTITAVKEQEKLRDRYWEVFGKDPDSAGHFAFAISLMRSVEAGAFPMDEALAMVSARESEVFVRRAASRQVASGYEYAN
ncbi:MAG: hypothetical protein ABI771_04745 [Betaproteobacteria bacterium]